MSHQIHLSKSGSGWSSMTACGRNILRTPMSAEWSEYKQVPVEERCAKCEASKQAALNRKMDTKKGSIAEDGMPKNMTPSSAVRILEKTWKSIGSHVSRGGSVHSWRGSELRMRYDDHRSWLRNKHIKEWEAYCKKHGFHLDHDGSDIFA